MRMKFDIFKVVIIFCIGLLIAWGLAEICIDEKQSKILAGVVSVCYLLAGIGYGIKIPKYPRSEANGKVAISVALIAITIIDFAFAFFALEVSTMIIPNAIITLLSLFIVKLIYKSKL